ncbi:MAG TPA: GNAT family N-acetyltransferase, partial [Bacillaceae bacterium]
MITLRAIDKDNWEEAISLKVKPEQRQFVASNLYSVAQVQFLDDFQAMGLYEKKDGPMVGFAMYGIDPDDRNFWIYRHMIDQKHQGKGLGSAALQCILEDIRSRNESVNAAC